MKLSVVIPVYNEKKTVLAVLTAVKKVVLPEKILEKEIILVDDCSTDGTREILEEVEINGSLHGWAGNSET